MARHSRPSSDLPPRGLKLPSKRTVMGRTRPIPQPPAPNGHTASAVDQQRGLTPWPAGQSGNPLGRKKGSRNRLSSAFLAALSDHFDAHGADAIHRVWKNKPDIYLRVIGAVVPHKLETSLEVTNIFAQYNLTDPGEFAD